MAEQNDTKQFGSVFIHMTLYSLEFYKNININIKNHFKNYLV